MHVELQTQNHFC